MKTALIGALGVLCAASLAQAHLDSTYDCFDTSATHSLTLGNVSVSLTQTGQSWYMRNTDNSLKVWTNVAALEEMNKDLNLTLTAADFSCVNHASQGGKRATMTLDFSNAEDYTQYTGAITLYVVVASEMGTATTDFPVTVSGMKSGYTVSYALYDGDGFAGTSTPQVASYTPVLVKITGELEGTTLSIAADRNKNGFGLVALKGINSVPEPATATLSLLALAGLAARRRRK